jgi:hypothetical protein
MRSLATLVLILTGLILAAVGFELGSPWPYQMGLILGLGATGVSAVAAIRQYRESLPFVYEFSESNWKERPSQTVSGPQFVLEVPESEHAKGKHTVTDVFKDTEFGFDEVMCGQGVTSSGSVFITASSRFSGKVIVK